VHLALGWLLPSLLLLVVQGFLVFREQIFSPIDELQHTDYVRAVADEGHPPIYGDDRVDPSLLAVYFHTYPRVALTPADVRNLPLFLGLSYEALQSPVFYVVAAPVYRALEGDLRRAIYGVRLLNVAFSVALFVVLVLLLRRAFSVRHRLAVAITMALLLPPGVALRHSQVTNDVLVALLLALFLYLLVPLKTTRPAGRAFLLGALLSASILVKVTALGAIASLAAARPGRLDLPKQLAAGIAGFGLPLIPWLAWALPVYGQPLPWTARHLVIWDPALHAPPQTLAGWARLVRHLIHYFWFPWEWQAPSASWRWFGRLAMLSGSALVLAGLIWGIRRARRWDQSMESRAALLALLALTGLAAGYLVIAVGAHRVFETDGRELYGFVAALALLLGGLGHRLGERISLPLFSAMVGIWLAVDAGLFLAGTCDRCFP
jgi:4-amino-4-deoxy-L-arabinose transferase-like glycosyltransferase